MIESPLEGLDLSSFLTSSNSRSSAVYDLYSVINHHGTLSSGHYVNLSRNSLDESWYKFDDDVIEPITNSNDIITENSYVLFYQKRNMKISPDQHWCLRLPQVQKALDEARDKKMTHGNGVAYIEETDENFEEDDDNAPLISGTDDSLAQVNPKSTVMQPNKKFETLRKQKAAELVREVVEKDFGSHDHPAHHPQELVLKKN